MTSWFFSYSRADATAALRLADDLIAAGIPLWVDQYDIRPSQHWDRAVEAAVHACTGMIVVLSPSSAASPNVADEISVALDRQKRVIPLMIERCTVPLRMTRMQFIDATADYPRALRQCLAEIARGDDAPRTALRPDPAPGPAARLDPAALDAARARLTTVVGPIASVLVKTAASRARTAAELDTMLADQLTTPADRARFLKTAPVPSSSMPAAPAAAPPSGGPADLPRTDVAGIAAALAHSLGPIARQLVDREQRSATSTTDLCQRLAALVPNDRERAAFLKATERLHH